MVGNQSAGVANLLINLDGFHKVDIAFIRVYLDEVVAVTTNIAEVDVEDLVTRTEIPDDVKDLLARVLQHLRDRPLAEIEYVIGAFLNTDEFL